MMAPAETTLTDPVAAFTTPRVISPAWLARRMLPPAPMTWALASMMSALVAVMSMLWFTP